MLEASLLPVEHAVRVILEGVELPGYGDGVEEARPYLDRIAYLFVPSTFDPVTA